jgi:hypothetical protein
MGYAGLESYFVRQVVLVQSEIPNALEAVTSKNDGDPHAQRCSLSRPPSYFSSLYLIIFPLQQASCSPHQQRQKDLGWGKRLSSGFGLKKPRYNSAYSAMPVVDMREILSGSFVGALLRLRVDG